MISHTATRGFDLVLMMSSGVVCLVIPENWLDMVGVEGLRVWPGGLCTLCFVLLLPGSSGVGLLLV